MNLKIDDRICAKNPFSVAEFEKEIVENTIAYEKQLVQKKLDAIASRYQEDNLEIDGIVYFRKIVPTTVSIGRVSVTWHRPIYQGSRNGKKIRHYPADLDLNLPRKTTTSYQVLTNCALLAAFLPFNVCKKVISLLMGVGISEASVKRYSESVGQFAKENLEEIIENRQDMINLSEDEILIASIDGSSSLINGSSAKSNKKRKKKANKKFNKDDYLKEAKVFRLSIYNKKTKKITKTILAHSSIRQKEDVKEKITKLVSLLNIPEGTKIYAIADGAPWVQDILENIHSNVDFLVDFYHASSYVSKIGEIFYFTQNRQGRKKAKKLCSLLKKSGGYKTVSAIKAIRTKVEESEIPENKKSSDLKKIDAALQYLEPRVDYMDYQEAAINDRPIGSGFIESACKIIVKQRLGISGGRFYLEAAERIMMLRCLIMMDAWEELCHQIYRKNFFISHCRPSSTYEPVIKRAA